MTIAKGPNSLANVEKLRRNNPNLDLVMVNGYAKFDQIPSIRSKILTRKQILTKTKGHNHVVNLQKLTCNNPNKDLVKVNAFAQFVHQIVLKILSRNKILTIIKCHKDVVNL